MSGIKECVRRLYQDSRLSKQQAEIFCRQKVSGMNAEAIADDLGISEGSVRSQLQRIREKTRESRQHVEIVEEYDDGSS